MFATFPEDLQGKFYRHTEMTDAEIKDLVDKHFLFRGKDKMQAASGECYFQQISYVYRAQFLIARVVLFIFLLNGTYSLSL